MCQIHGVFLCLTRCTVTLLFPHRTSPPTPSSWMVTPLQRLMIYGPSLSPSRTPAPITSRHVIDVGSLLCLSYKYRVSRNLLTPSFPHDARPSAYPSYFEITTLRIPPMPSPSSRPPSSDRVPRRPEIISIHSSLDRISPPHLDHQDCGGILSVPYFSQNRYRMCSVVEMRCLFQGKWIKIRGAG